MSGILPTELLVLTFSSCNSIEKRTYEELQGGVFFKEKEHEGPDPRILAILACVCKQWNQASEYNFLWEQFAKIQGIPIDLSFTDEQPGTIKSRVKEFVLALLNFPHYKKFEKNVIKRRVVNPQPGIKEQYDQAPKTPPLFDALRRYRAFFPCSEALHSPAVTSLVTREDFEGVTSREKARLKLFLQRELTYLIFLSEEQSLKESWGYDAEGEQIPTDVVCILQKNPSGKLVEKRIDLTQFKTKEAFEIYMKVYLHKCRTEREDCFYDPDFSREISAAVKTGLFHGVMTQRDAMQVLLNGGGGIGIGCYMFYIDDDTYRLTIGTLWANGETVHKPLPRFSWSLSPKNPDQLSEVRQRDVVPIDRTHVLEPATTFANHPELAKNSRIAYSLLHMRGFHGEISRTETEKRLTITDSSASSYLFRISSNEKNRLILSLRYQGKDSYYKDSYCFEHKLVNEEFLEKIAAAPDFLARLEEYALKQGNLQALPCKEDVVKGYISDLWPNSSIVLFRP